MRHFVCLTKVKDGYKTNGDTFKKSRMCSTNCKLVQLGVQSLLKIAHFMCTGYIHHDSSTNEIFAFKCNHSCLQVLNSIAILEMYL